MNNVCNSKKIAIVFFATLLGLVSVASAALYSQESDASKASPKATQKKKAAKPANSSDATNPAPATSPSKNASKDTTKATKTPVGKDTVWVNTATGIYHKKGTRYYGKTKEGKYMPEDEAVQAGYKRSKRN